VIRRSLMLTAALALSAASAHAEGWSIGSNLGFSVVKPKGGGDDLVVVGAPGSVGLIVPGFQPGLRIAFPVDAKRQNEIYFDGGLSLFNGSGETLTNYEVTVNYQHTFSLAGSSSPYVTVGGGLMGQNFAGESNTNTLLGGGIGGLTRVRDEHGAVRVELRYDYIFEDEMGFEGGHLISLKVGFDLWLQ